MLEFKKIDDQEVRVYRDNHYIGRIVTSTIGGRKVFILGQNSVSDITIAEMREIVAKSTE